MGVSSPLGETPTKKKMKRGVVLVTALQNQTNKGSPKMDTSDLFARCLNFQCVEADTC